MSMNKPKKIIGNFKKFLKIYMNKKIIVCYIPKSSSNWIIEYLFIDISKASVNKEVEYVICKNLINLFYLI